MKILITGFKPFGQYRTNITEEIIRNLGKQKGVQTTVLPVEFDAAMFRNAITQSGTDVVLGLGMCRAGKKIRIERRARNVMMGNGRRAQKILEHGPEYQRVNFKVAKDSVSRINYNAGAYVCNYYMYTASLLAKEKNIQFAFFHIPARVDARKAALFLNRKIKQIKASS